MPVDQAQDSIMVDKVIDRSEELERSVSQFGASLVRPVQLEGRRGNESWS
jgi:hypothetical protein